MGHQILGGTMRINGCERYVRVALLVLVVAIGVEAADPTAKPEFGTFGFDFTGMDKNTKPGDDFFRFANGAWLDRTQIPSDNNAISLRILMNDKMESLLHEMLERA